MSAYKIQMSGNYPVESIQQDNSILHLYLIHLTNVQFSTLLKLNKAKYRYNSPGFSPHMRQFCVTTRYAKYTKTP